MELEWTEKLNRIPPFAYRLIAARHSIAIGPDEIAERSGLSRSTVQRVSELKTWAGVKIEVAERFVRGCGFSIHRPKEAMRRMRVLQERGIKGLKHLNVSGSAPLWKRGANGNRIKFFKRIITQ